MQDIATITITINMARADYERFKAESKGNARMELEKAIIEKLGGEIVVKSLKAEFGELK